MVLARHATAEVTERTRYAEEGQVLTALTAGIVEQWRGAVEGALRSGALTVRR